jgi:hypothetical protein
MHTSLSCHLVTDAVAMAGTSGGSSSPASQDYLKSKIQIGNCRGAVQYGPTQVAFHYDDIDPKARARKEEVKSWSKSSRLVPNNEWDQSIVTNEKRMERRTRENFVFDRSNPYQYNYRAETLGPKLIESHGNTKPNKFKITLQQSGNNILTNGSVSLSGSGPGGDRGAQSGPLYSNTIQTFKRTEEMPIHPKLTETFESNWNLSNLVQKKEFQKSFQDLNQKSSQNSQKKAKKLLSNYMTPMERTIAFQEEVRKQKREGAFTLEKHVFQPPEEPVNRKALVNTCAVEPSLKFKTTRHTGVWEMNKTEGRSVSLIVFSFLSYLPPSLASCRRYMWSDTGSYLYESRGDVVTVHNPDAYNYSNPTLSMTR